jgi:protein-S-isoprenylcysteine O-methyltransferase Ste14
VISAISIRQQKIRTNLKPNIMTTKSLLHIACLAVLAIAGFVGVFSEPVEDAALGEWMLTLLWSKAAGVGAFVAAWWLFKRWLPTDKVLQAFDRSGQRGLEKDL